MKVIFTCGGTAGHVNPALALAGYMRQQDPKARFLFVGTPDGMERDLVEKAGYPFRSIPMGGFQRSLPRRPGAQPELPGHAGQVPQPCPGHSP